MAYICPICGYNELEDDPEAPSFEICSSCSFQFGVSDDDKGYTYKQWQEKWISEGMIWSTNAKTPENWDPVRQLENIKNL